jgi:hypothetical protein
MDVFVIEGVFDVAVQVTYVRTRLDGELLLDVLCPDKFAPLLPLKKKIKSKTSSKWKIFIFPVAFKYMVLLRSGLDMCRVASIISLKLWLDMCRAMSSCDVGT